MELFANNFWFALGLTLFAGLATGIGSLMGLLSKKFSPSFLAVSLGFSGGVMGYVSFVEIFSKSQDLLIPYWGEKMGVVLATVAFFVGMFIVAIIDKLVPEAGNPHEVHVEEDYEGVAPTTTKKGKAKLFRMGILSALAIAIHNFPEGMATFMAALVNPAMGISIAIAIAIHNIPEGIAVSVPIYYATKSKKKAFIYSFLSGLAEPVGALVGYFILRSFLNEQTLGYLFAGVAGIMVYISLDVWMDWRHDCHGFKPFIGGIIKLN